MFYGRRRINTYNVTLICERNAENNNRRNDYCIRHTRGVVQTAANSKWHVRTEKLDSF